MVRVEELGCKGRQSDPSGVDKAEWKTHVCGERGGGGDGMEQGSTGDVTVSVYHFPASSFLHSKTHFVGFYLSKPQQQLIVQRQNINRGGESAE